jgi:Tol biopolymer transport system component
MSRAERLIVALLVSASALGQAASSHGATLFDPRLRFRVLPTEHFLIYFHQGEDRMALRLASIAEDTWRTLAQRLDAVPPPLTHVVLADQTEIANAYATPLPFDTIVIYAAWPSGREFNFDEWLRLAFTHEFAHLLHVDRSEGWARAVRAVFGRTAWAFPNLFLPKWQLEGLAIYEESAATGLGRLHAGNFRAIVGEAARDGLLEPLDRVSGGLTDWPGGLAAYAYGLEFHQYLSERFGADTLARLARATAGRVPYTASRVFKDVFGEPLGTLWQDFQRSLAPAVQAPAMQDRATRLTHEGFSVTGPRFDRVVCPTCPADILYSGRNPDGFPGLYRVAATGSTPARLATRYLGSTVAAGRDVVYFDQVERRRNTGMYSDLYEWSRATGRVRQVTRDARLLDPDLSPDGQTLVCVRARPGQRDLVLLATADLTTGAIITLSSAPETQFNNPRWSPDGRSIAVERHRPGSMPEVVIVDVETRTIRVIASDDRTRFVTPAWRPDGGALVLAAAPADDTFNLFEFAVDGSSARQLTHTTGGATEPDVSPDGKTIAFVGYTTNGDDVFSMPYPDATSGPGASPHLVLFEAPPPAEPATALTSHAYSPSRTLAPTSWSPVVEAATEQVRVGATVAGSDVLGYHAYVATATWLASGPADAHAPRAASPDWRLSYAYDRWTPTFYAAASSATSFFSGPATSEGTPAAATRRERQFEAGVFLPVQHVRSAYAGQLSLLRVQADDTLPTGSRSQDRTAMHVAAEVVTSRSYGYSISPEDGMTAGVTAELVRRGLGSSADATTITGDFRAFLPAPAPHHVVALRVAGGVSTGDARSGRTFLLGGGSPQASVISFGSGAVSLLRGFPSHSFAGSHVALLNAEYRWPIARPQRGLGTWPLFLHSLHGAVFVDAGHTWTRTFRRDAAKMSVGAEFSTAVIAAYAIPVTATVGAAWGHDGSGTAPGGATVYVRIGRAF